MLSRTSSGSATSGPATFCPERWRHGPRLPRLTFRLRASFRPRRLPALAWLVPVGPRRLAEGPSLTHRSYGHPIGRHLKIKAIRFVSFVSSLHFLPVVLGEPRGDTLLTLTQRPGAEEERESPGLKEIGLHKPCRSPWSTGSLAPPQALALSWMASQPRGAAASGRGRGTLAWRAGLSMAQAA